jgi:hypothetical protein
MTAHGPSATSSDVRYYTAIGGQADIRRAGLKHPNFMSTRPKSVYAMEAFCFLLTVEDLWSIEANQDLLSQNLLLQNYRLSF